MPFELHEDTLIHPGNYQHVLTPELDVNPRRRGYVPRDLERHPVGCFENGPPMRSVDIPLLQRSDWPTIAKDLEQSKARLSDIRNSGNNGERIPSLNQGNFGYCHTADTEVLTDRGWVAFPDYDYSSPVATVNPVSHAMEFQRPFEKHVYEYDGEIIYSSNRRLDFAVTPDHQMYVRKWNESKRCLDDKYSFVRAGDLGWYSGFMHAPNPQIGTGLEEISIPGDRSYSGDDFVKLMGIITSDGFAGNSEKSRNLVSFCYFRDEMRQQVCELASRLGFREQPGRPGVWNRWNAGALAAWIRENVYTSSGISALTKKVPEIIKWTAPRQIALFLEWFGDRTRTGNQFFSVSKRLVDDIQEILFRIGRRSTITKNLPRCAEFHGKLINSKESFTLTVSSTERLSIDRRHNIETDSYKGLVYCAAVPNHTLLTRRNGSVLISSNCWMHSGTHALMLTRALAGMPYIPLSAFAGAATIKHGKDEGGWGPQGLEFICKNGLPDQKYWPQGSADLRHGTKECWDNAALHKGTETWMDLDVPAYDRTFSQDQVATLILLCVPGTLDYNWWGHSVAWLDLVDGNAMRDRIRMSSGKIATAREVDLIFDMGVEGGGWGIRIWNSWSDDWKEHGTSVITGTRCWPDGAGALRRSRPSVN